MISYFQKSNKDYHLLSLFQKLIGVQASLKHAWKIELERRSCQRQQNARARFLFYHFVRHKNHLESNSNFEFPAHFGLGNRCKLIKETQKNTPREPLKVLSSNLNLNFPPFLGLKIGSFPSKKHKMSKRNLALALRRLRRLCA